jgi:hypothetical protein
VTNPIVGMMRALSTWWDATGNIYPFAGISIQNMITGMIFLYLGADLIIGIFSHKGGSSRK